MNQAHDLLERVHSDPKHHTSCLFQMTSFITLSFICWSINLMWGKFHVYELSNGRKTNQQENQGLTKW